jgi:hypothetical protein
MNSPPGHNPLCPFRAEEFLADKIGENLAAEELSQSRVVDPGDLMEEDRLVHPVLGHQEMEVGVKIHPVPKCLSGRNNSGHKVAPGHDFEITGQ